MTPLTILILGIADIVLAIVLLKYRKQALELLSWLEKHKKDIGKFEQKLTDVLRLIDYLYNIIKNNNGQIDEKTLEQIYSMIKEIIKDP